MCQLFGISARQPVVLNEYLREFYSHSGRHPHGWGLALMNGEEVRLEKEPVQADQSRYLKERLSVPVKSRTAFAHIRYATIGNVEYRNCHPFMGKDCTGRPWVLIHNGTIFDYPPMHCLVSAQRGDTDSERILLYVLKEMSREALSNGAPDAGRRFRLLDEMVSDMAKGNKLNLLLYDGEYLYMHTNYEGSLQIRQTKDGVAFSTEPLGKGIWNPAPMTTLLGYRDGVVQFVGTNHGHAYEENEEDLKYLYEVFASL
ncbi:MAG: class II glutamine amidotransferase [Clostridiales bacterium]|nr:class II glutamine amidotransferase [Clostridiales bacterium]